MNQTTYSPVQKYYCNTISYHSDYESVDGPVKPSMECFDSKRPFFQNLALVHAALGLSDIISF